VLSLSSSAINESRGKGGGHQVSEIIHDGMELWRSGDRTICKLHYTADPDKGAGEKTYVPEINKHLSPWAYKQFLGMTNRADYMQEYEIDFSAKLGTLLYQLNREATLLKSFPIPRNWTRYTACDPHPRTPHAWLWLAVDPWGEVYVYREFWPSLVCLRYEAEGEVGDRGNIPEDDRRLRVKQYVELVKFMESSVNPRICFNGMLENLNNDEKIAARVIDYSARAFRDTTDSEDQRSIQERYEDAGKELDFELQFEDSKKDMDVGIEMVNDLLRPSDVEQPDGSFKPTSRLHIFADKCPELVFELESNRYELLANSQVDKQDPQAKAVQKRKHLTDCLRYLVIRGLEYQGAKANKPKGKGWKPVYEGINW
jgi:hypothetical protein